MTPSATLSFKNQFFASFYEAAELCKASDDGGLLILLELLNDRVAEGDASDPRDCSSSGGSTAK